MISVTALEPYQRKVHASLLANTAKAVLQHADGPQDSEVTIQIADDETLQELNQQYIGIDTPTDVLSFPLEFVNPDTNVLYLGDIVISYPTAAKQAEAAGCTVEEELKLLVVHGMLHLLGYDHAEPDEKAEMWQVQEDILKALEIKARPSE